MQTSRHPVFAALALSTVACRPPVGQTPSASLPPSEPAISTAPSLIAPAPRRQVVVVHDPTPDSPHIASARFRSREVLKLTFNEPIAVHEGFDPQQFRLSLGMRYQDEEEGVAYYYDPGTYDDDEGPILLFDHLEAEGDDAVLLHMNIPIPADLCETLLELELEGLKDADVTGGLYLHYHHEPERPAIVDTDDNALDDVSAQWVIRGAKAASYYGDRLQPTTAFGPLLCPRP